jgi:hypothetical protein
MATFSYNDKNLSIEATGKKPMKSQDFYPQRQWSKLVKKGDKNPSLLRLIFSIILPHEKHRGGIESSFDGCI